MTRFEVRSEFVQTSDGGVALRFAQAHPGPPMPAEDSACEGAEHRDH